MVTIATAPPETRLGRARRRRKLWAVEGVVLHATMVLAMIPCVIGGPAVAHGAALFALLAASVWASIRIRQDHPRDAQLVDLLTMSMLSLAAMLAHPSMEVVHGHGEHRDDSPATTIALTSAVVWILLRGVHRDRAGSIRSEILPSGMVFLMVGSVLIGS